MSPALFVVQSERKTNLREHRGHRGGVPVRASDGAVYVLGAVLGLGAGWLDVKIGDLLLTALFVLASTMLLGALRPPRPWRWTIEVASFVPALHLLAYFFVAEKPDRAHIYESFLGFLTGVAGAYGGALGRRGLRELFGEK